MSWGGCLTGFLAAGCLLALSDRRASLGRGLLAAEDCRVTLACLVAAADSLNGLPEDDLTTTGLAFVLDPDGLPPTATAAPGALGAVGWTTVGRTGLGFWDGRDAADGCVFTAAEADFADDLSLVAVATPGALGAMGRTTVGRTSLGCRDGLGSTDGGFAIARPVFTLVVVPLPVVLPVAGWSAVLALSLTTLGRRGPLLAVAAILVALALAGLTDSGAASLAGGEGFLCSVRVADGVAPGVSLCGALVCGGVGRAVSAALDFSRTLSALPVGLACCLGAD